MSAHMNGLLLGAVIMASLTAALFFLRFWRTTGDRFFLFFGMSFFIDGMDRLWIASNPAASEDGPEYFLLRLVAYGLILYAIIDKNRPRDKDH